MGWPEEPTDWGAPGHASRGDEIEAIRDQIKRLSAPVCGTRWVSGVTIAAGISTTEILTNIATGIGRFESGRRYKIKARLHIQMSTTSNVATLRARVGTVTGTLIGSFQHTMANTGTGFWRYHEFDFCPTADILDTIVLTGQIVSGGGTFDLEVGSTTDPVFYEAWDSGHLTDVTTVV